ncbi:MAG: hypothetical protein UU67_C0038G0018 [Candidatus Daviesbacteria bacterium GW2011_GWB1_41_5]|uniref:Uncharacterized protein n=1 Tax=Candidatus Daviesbacteria bacterium GW2011_GWB1_41_5 TaxID=1618429 RepID=A0A0G0YTC7_9BACT|nr:MAG: hypothetical protein UU67_C0038G0018 [Candidatus Daviesbacteria bacterium GW2011_GWB1_41_5]
MEKRIRVVRQIETGMSTRAKDPLFSPFLDALIPKIGSRDFGAFCEWVGILPRVGKTARGRERMIAHVVHTAAEAFRD